MTTLFKMYLNYSTTEYDYTLTYQLGTVIVGPFIQDMNYIITQYFYNYYSDADNT